MSSVCFVLYSFAIYLVFVNLFGWEWGGGGGGSGRNYWCFCGTMLPSLITNRLRTVFLVKSILEKNWISNFKSILFGKKCLFIIAASLSYDNCFRICYQDIAKFAYISSFETQSEILHHLVVIYYSDDSRVLKPLKMDDYFAGRKTVYCGNSISFLNWILF